MSNRGSAAFSGQGARQFVYGGLVVPRDPFAETISGTFAKFMGTLKMSRTWSFEAGRAGARCSR